MNEFALPGLLGRLGAEGKPYSLKLGGCSLNRFWKVCNRRMRLRGPHAAHTSLPARSTTMLRRRYASAMASLGRALTLFNRRARHCTQIAPHSQQLKTAKCACCTMQSTAHSSGASAHTLRSEHAAGLLGNGPVAPVVVGNSALVLILELVAPTAAAPAPATIRRTAPAAAAPASAAPAACAAAAAAFCALWAAVSCGLLLRRLLRAPRFVAAGPHACRGCAQYQQLCSS